MQKFSASTNIHSTKTLRSEFTDQKVQFLFLSLAIELLSKAII